MEGVDIPEILHSVKKSKSFITPVGTIYMQLPGKDDPASLGMIGTWTDVSSTYAGNFFRVAGGDASIFESGTQDDSFQGHRHTLGQNINAGGSTGRAGYAANGVGETHTDLTMNVKDPKTDGINGTPRTDSETRPVNETIKVWERSA